MSAAIIGGAIAGVLGAAGGAITGLLLEHHREKVRQLAIVNALIIETAENLTICTSPKAREMWWWAPFKLEAYHAYKGQFLFLPKKVRIQLISTAFLMEGVNIGMQIHVSKVDYGQLVKEKPLPPAPELIKELKFVNKELHKWRTENTRSFSERISNSRRRLRNFISTKIRNNSKLNHS